MGKWYGGYCPWPLNARKLDPSELEQEEVNWLADQIIHGGWTSRPLGEEFGLSHKTILKYVKLRRLGKPRNLAAGRPPKVSTTQKEWLLDQMTNRQHQLRVEEFKQLVVEAVRRTCTERKEPHGHIDNVDDETLRRLEVDLGIKKGLAETTTHARANACADVRNMVTFAAMNYLMTGLTNPVLTLNADATQYTVGSGKGDKAIKYIPNGDLSMKVLPLAGEGGLVSFFIKFYMLMTAAGHLADPIYIMADSSMDEEDIHVLPVQGMGVNTNPFSVGYLVWMKTRSPNAHFFRWFNNLFLIPFVTNLRIAYGIDDETPAWYQLDGERNQISVYDEKAILDALEAAGIVVGKPPGSTTEITQPADRGKCFCATKCVNKSICDADIDDKYMIGVLEQAFADHEAAMKDRYPGYTPISVPHKKMAVFGLLRIQMAQGEVLKKKMVQSSFRETGVYPYSLEKIIGSCKTKIECDEVLEIVNAVPRLAKKIGEQGEKEAKEKKRKATAELNKEAKKQAPIKVGTARIGGKIKLTLV